MHAMASPDPKNIQARLRAGESKRAIARSLGVAPSTVRRAATRTAVEPARAIRTPARAPVRQSGPYAWDLERIRRARDCQMRGDFEIPVRLAEAMRTDDALFTAYQARVATQIAITLDWRAANSGIGESICARARSLIHLPQVVRQGILGTMANHGLAIGYAPPSAVDTPEGPSLCMTLTEWPLEHVRWDRGRCELMTRVRDLPDVPITHGVDGWVVFRKFGIAPWTQDAALLAAALLWPAHAGGISDWAGASYAHGQPKLVGELPEGVRLEKDDGTGDLTAEACAMLELATALASGDAGAGVRPAGSKLDLLESGSNAWQVFDKLTTNRESAAARIYLGTDAILGSRGGAPGIDIGALFGIATTRIQGDLEALERGFREGMIAPWMAAHGYQQANAPAAVYEIPDSDADARSQQEADAVERLEKSVASLKSIGAEVTQDVIDALRETLGVSVTAKLVSLPIQLGPADVARVMRVREARASQGLPPFGDERDELTISQLDAGGGAAPAPVETTAPAPAARRRHVRAEPVDADGDGKINEAEAADAAANEPIDADGDGVVNEAERRAYNDPEVKRARKNVAKALAKHETKLGKKAELQRTADEASAKRAALSNDDEIGNAIVAGTPVPEPAGKLEDAAKAREAAETAHSDAEDTLEQARASRADLETTSSDSLDEPYWVDASGSPINGHEAKLQLDQEIPQHEAAVTAANAERIRTKNEHIRLDKEFRKAGREADRAQEKLDSFDDGSDALQESLGEYAQAHTQVLSDVQAERDQAQSDFDEDPSDPEAKAFLAKKQAQLDAHEKVHAEATKGLNDASAPLVNAPGQAQPDRDTAHSIVTGPKGGQYYLGPTGEPVYVK